LSEPLRLKNRDEWRSWLEAHHLNRGEVWLVIQKKNSGKSGGVGYEEAVEDALAFGWIDSKMRGLGSNEFAQRFTPRKKGSVWSLRNKKIAEKLITQGEMSEFGYKAVDDAKRSGWWDDAYSSTSTPQIPEDLLAALASHGLKQSFQSLSNSAKLQHIFWVNQAKTNITRKKRMDEILKKISKGEK